MKKGFQAAALLFTVGATSAAQAALVTFEVDPARSVLTLSQVGIAGQPATPQPGGNSASYTGTIDAEIVGNTIQFPGGLWSVFASNSATPLLPGGSPANYGIVTLDGDTAALRDVKFAFQGEDLITPYTLAPDGTIINPVNDEPDAPSVAISFTRDVDLINAPPTSTFRDVVLDNFGFPPRHPAAKLTRSGDLMTLEIPVDITHSWAVFGANDSQFQLVGKIVATNGVVPEPGSIGLLALGGTMLLARRRKA